MTWIYSTNFANPLTIAFVSSMIDSIKSFTFGISWTLPATVPPKMGALSTSPSNKFSKPEISKSKIFCVDPVGIPLKCSDAPSTVAPSSFRHGSCQKCRVVWSHPRLDYWIFCTKYFLKLCLNHPNQYSWFFFAK